MTKTNMVSFQNQYQDIADEILVKEAINNNNNIALECLIDRYKDIVNMKANKFFMVGSEKYDMVQEGYIGLYKAIKSYNDEKQNTFKTFAGVCIERQLITAVKNSNRQKHIPLNSSISLNATVYDSECSDTTILEILDTNKGEGDPLEIITKREYYKSLEKRLYDNLSEFETKVLNLYKNSYSYAMIAEKLDTKVKSVDTAIQRIRKKAQKLKGEL